MLWTNAESRYVEKLEEEGKGSVSGGEAGGSSPMLGYDYLAERRGIDAASSWGSLSGTPMTSSSWGSPRAPQEVPRPSVVTKEEGEEVAKNVTQQLLQALNTVFFDQLGFKGNREDYYDPRNSLIHEVLQRKTGNPITLSVVYMAVARRIGIQLHGSSCPSHFVLRGKHEDGAPFFVDVFNAGKIMTTEGCKEMMVSNNHVVGNTDLTCGCKELMVSKNHVVGSTDLEPMPPIRVYARMMRNLINSNMIIGKGDKAMLWTERIRVMETAFSKMQESIDSSSETELSASGSNLGGWRGGHPRDDVGP
ncbi:Transglutaminase-like superfamily-domain-containing protein [Baffinella frigidus]|nr:Transglutaminase-like superfamily-domain-containing protein [Cryptophyta sp. CCMP2293]